MFTIAHIRMLGYTWFQNNKKRITDIICACGFSKYFLKTVIRFLQQMENVKSSDSWLHGKADQSVITKVQLHQLTIIAWLVAVLFPLSQKSIPGLGQTPILSNIYIKTEQEKIERYGKLKGLALFQFKPIFLMSPLLYSNTLCFISLIF